MVIPDFWKPDKRFGTCGWLCTREVLLGWVLQGSFSYRLHWFHFDDVTPVYLRWLYNLGVISPLHSCLLFIEMFDCG